MDEKNTPVVKPVLDYATPGPDGLPQYVPEAEQLIDAGHGPKAIRKLLGGTDRAVDYFCKSLTRRYSESGLSKGCDCGRKDASYVIQLSWFVRSSFGGREVQLLREAYGVCTTLHAVCPNCHTDWVDRIGQSLRLGQILTAISLGLLIMLILGHTFERLSGSGTHYFGLGWLMCLIVFLICKPALKRIAVYEYPTEVKNILRKGVTLQGIACVYRQEDGKLSEVE